jgi:hypothetical protein
LRTFGEVAHGQLGCQKDRSAFVLLLHHWDASRDKSSDFLLNAPSLQHVSQYSQVSINSEQKSAIIQEELRLKESNSEKAPMSGFSASN